MSERKTTGFGVPNDIDPHHFVVDIPAARANPVVITEQFGLSGGSNGLPDSLERCRLNQDAWNAVRRERAAQSRSPSQMTAGSIQARSRHQIALYQGYPATSPVMVGSGAV